MESDFDTLDRNHYDKKIEDKKNDNEMTRSEEKRLVKTSKIIVHDTRG